MDTQEFLDWIKKEGIYKKMIESESSIKRVLMDSLNAKDEKVLIITDLGMEKRRIAPILSAAYYLAAKKKGLDTHLVVQSVKESGEQVDPEVDNALYKLEKNNIVIIAVSNKLGKTVKIGKSFRGFMRKRYHRFITAPSLGAVTTDKLRYVRDAINIDYTELRRKQLTIKKVFDAANEILVTAPGGSNFTINMKGVISISNNGNYRTPSSGGNLPTGEVYFPPAKNGVNGTITIDVSSRNRGGTVLIKKPVRLEVEKSTITNIEGEEEARMLDESLSRAEEHAKYPHRVRKIGEFGIGFNPNAKIIGAMIVDEKVHGTAHVAIGSNYWFGGDIRTIVHYDQVFRKPRIDVNGKVLEIDFQMIK